MAHVNKPTAILTAASGAANSTPINQPEYNRWGALQGVIIEVLAASGTPTFELQPQQSNDGVNWYNLGSAISTTGLSSVTVTLPWFRAVLSAISGGAVTVKIS